MTRAKIEAALVEIDHFRRFALQVLEYAGRLRRPDIGVADSQAMKRAAIVVTKTLKEMRKP
jgi:hypothetical protein